MPAVSKSILQNTESFLRIVLCDDEPRRTTTRWRWDHLAWGSMTCDSYGLRSYNASGTHCIGEVQCCLFAFFMFPFMWHVCQSTTRENAPTYAGVSADWLSTMRSYPSTKQSGLGCQPCFGFFACRFDAASSTSLSPASASEFPATARKNEVRFGGLESSSASRFAFVLIHSPMGL